MGKGNRNRSQRTEEIKKAPEKGYKKRSPAVTITLSIAAVVLVGLIAWVIVLNSGILLKNSTALKVGDTEIKGLEFKFNYDTNVNSFLNTYAQYLSMFGIDASKSLSKQQYYNEDKTWAQSFIESTTPQLIETAILEAEGKKNGFTMSAEQEKNVDDYILTMESFAKEQGLPVNVFLSRNYGNGMTSQDIRKFVERRIYSASYYEKVIDDIKTTDEQIQNYYKDHKADFDTADIRSFAFKYTVPEPEKDEDGNPIENTDESYKDEARAKAEALLAAAIDEDSFVAAAFEALPAEDKEKNQGKDFTLTKEIKSKSALGEKTGEWVFDYSRVEGDKTIIEENNAFNVIYFKRLGLSEYNAVSVRHILFKGDTDEQKTKAEELLNQWKQGEATEESFIALVADNSEDTGSVDNGGFYSNFNKGQMVAEFEDWSFSPERKPGDTAVIKTSIGYHVMYFSEMDGLLWKKNAENKIKSEEYEKYIDNLKETYTVTENKNIMEMASK